MKKVYVTQETEHQFSDAERFGEVVFLTKDDLTNNRNSLWNEGMMANLARQLRRFDPEQDSIVIAGSPYVAAAVFMLLGHLKHQEVRVLRWDNRDYKYIPMFIQLRREVIA